MTVVAGSKDTVRYDVNQVWKDIKDLVVKKPGITGIEIAEYLTAGHKMTKTQAQSIINGQKRLKSEKLIRIRTTFKRNATYGYYKEGDPIAIVNAKQLEPMKHKHKAQPAPVPAPVPAPAPAGLVITINGIKFTASEARKLYNELHVLFGGTK